MKVGCLAVFLLLAFSQPASSLERFEIVTTQELLALLQERSEGERNFILLNSLDELISEHHSIPGSINIPWNRIQQESHRLGPDKNQLIITYCMGYR